MNEGERERRRAYMREWERAHREERNRARRLKRKHMTPEQRERERERNRACYHANRDHYVARRKEWERANPDKMYVYRKRAELKRLRKEKAENGELV